MTLKKIYKDATKKNWRLFLICFVLTSLWLVVMWKMPVKNTLKDEVRSYMLLICGVIVSGGALVLLIRGSREFKLYQLLYDFKMIELQMTENETLSMPEKHFYITRDYLIGMSGNLKILKRNSILKIKETKIPIRHSKKCYYCYYAYQIQGKAVAFLQIQAPKNEMGSEELVQVRTNLKEAFPGKTDL